ncbi:MAG: carboxypeptidase-like regulatory domain-containing protein [Terriglobia bacterium]|jgi:hypothetical protein
MRNILQGANLVQNRLPKLFQLIQNIRRRRRLSSTGLWSFRIAIAPLVVILLWAVPSAQAQIVDASLTGTVTDPTGAVTPGAAVTVTNTGTGVSLETSTNDLGGYNFPHLPPGQYTLSVRMAGFKITLITGIELLVNQEAMVNAQLQVGETTTEVQVSGAAPLVNTETASVGTVIDQKEVADLPLNLRRFGALAVLVPGSAPDNGGFASFSGTGSTFSETTYNANGGRSSSNGILIDGMLSRNLQTGGFGLNPPPDAVEEFKLQTDIYDAAFGLSAGSTINLVTKSGTNVFHGTVYEFLRNNDMDARNFFAVNQTNPLTGAEIPGTARPEYRRNQFGFAVGGPIRKNKTFFFANYEGLRQIQGLSSTAETPLDNYKQGDLSSFLTGTTTNLCGSGGPASMNFDSGQLFDPTTEYLYTCPSGTAAGSAVLAGTPIAGNMITNINPVAAKLLATNPFPEPNRPGYPNYVNNTPLVRHENQLDARVDQSFSPKDQVFVRYLLGKAYIDTPGGFPAFSSIIQSTQQDAVLGWTHTVSGHLLNEVRIGWNRQFSPGHCGENCPRPAGFLESLGITNVGSLGGPSWEVFPFQGFVNFGGIGDSLTPGKQPDMIEKYQDTLTWTHGRHTTRVGADMSFWQAISITGVCSVAYSYNGQYSGLAGELPGNAGISDFADFLMGQPDYGFTPLTGPDVNLVGGGWWSYYAQDDYKVSSNLALNLGLRYEYRRPEYDKRGELNIVVPTGPEFSGPGNALLVTPLPAAQNDALCTTPAYSWLLSSSGRCLVASSAQRTQLGITGRTRQTLMITDKRDFAPRLGLAWRPTGSDKLVLHGGGGTFYDLESKNWQENGSVLFHETDSYSPAFGAPPPLVNGAPANIQTAFGTTGVPPLSQQVFSYAPLRFITGRMYQWSSGVESQLGKDWALEVDYIGDRGAHLGKIHFPGNQPLPGVGALQPRRPYPDFAALQPLTTDANSWYDSLQTKLTKRYANGLTFLASYTYGKTLSDSEGDDGFSGGTGNLGQEDDHAWYLERARAYSDARHRFVFSYVYALPVGQGKRFLSRSGALNVALGGWEVSGITTFQSGFPISIFASQDFSNTGAYYTFRPDRICNGAGPKTLAEWFNPACFTDASLQAALAAGDPRVGDSGRNILDGPGINNWDLAALKDFRLAEPLKLQFRAEFYSAFNHPNWGLPNVTVGNPFIGRIGSASDSRDIQMALKLIF